MRFTFFRSAWKKVPTTLIDMQLTELKDTLITLRDQIDGLIDTSNAEALIEVSNGIQEAIWRINDEIGE